MTIGTTWRGCGVEKCCWSRKCYYECESFLIWCRFGDHRRDLDSSRQVEYFTCTYLQECRAEFYCLFLECIICRPSFCISGSVFLMDLHQTSLASSVVMIFSNLVLEKLVLTPPYAGYILQWSRLCSSYLCSHLERPNYSAHLQSNDSLPGPDKRAQTLILPRGAFCVIGNRIRGCNREKMSSARRWSDYCASWMLA